MIASSSEAKNSKSKSKSLHASFEQHGDDKEEPYAPSVDPSDVANPAEPMSETTKHRPIRLIISHDEEDESESASMIQVLSVEGNNMNGLMCDNASRGNMDECVSYDPSTRLSLHSVRTAVLCCYANDVALCISENCRRRF